MDRDCLAGEAVRAFTRPIPGWVQDAVSRYVQVGCWQVTGEIQIREVLPDEYEDTGALAQRAYAGSARPGDLLWDGYSGSAR
jgi:hypothetical protein